MADAEPDGALPWFQTAAGKTAPSVLPPWERENAKSRRRARRHPEQQVDASDGEQAAKGE